MIFLVLSAVATSRSLREYAISLSKSNGMISRTYFSYVISFWIFAEHGRFELISEGYPILHQFPAFQGLNTLRPTQNGRHFPYDIFKCIFLNESVWISIKIPLKFVYKVPINNIPALVQIMAWREQVTSHYLNKWWLDYRRIHSSLSLHELTGSIVKKYWKVIDLKVPYGYELI